MAQKLDPDCAMCFWGEARALGPNINLLMPEDAVAPAYAAAQQAKALAGKANPREQGLISALAASYGSDPKAARAPFDTAYADEMAKVATQFSDDDEIATLYAEVVMDLSPNLPYCPCSPALRRDLPQVWSESLICWSRASQRADACNLHRYGRYRSELHRLPLVTNTDISPFCAARLLNVLSPFHHA